MMAHSHLSFAAASWWLYCLAIGMPITGFQTLVSAVGGLLPDIDHPHSALGRRVRIISYPLSHLLGHRGLTHSLLMAIVLLAVLTSLTAIPAYEEVRWMVSPLCIGYLSHLFGDALTPSGVPLFYPHKKTYSLNLFKTRSILETIVVGALTLTVFFLSGLYSDLVTELQTWWDFWQRLVTR